MKYLKIPDEIIKACQVAGGLDGCRDCGCTVIECLRCLIEEIEKGGDSE